MIIAHGAGHAVIVPGGGVFADAVRQAQPRYHFSDLAAHRMAVLAMEQYAWLLNDMGPALRPCASSQEIRAALAERRVALWLPGPMVAADPIIAQSWDVSSDSLAAWLAGRLEAAALVLVKSASPPARPTPQELTALGLVDAAFPDYAAAAGCAVACYGPGETARLAGLLASR